ncbi:hypothetical protein [Polyangium spumosum]|uniref:Uncharacterized protein n=1 Tax=Polyangium spumosum TaxID=889282 RepID=A0A6N7PP06_9BACT|nr:hypothetical protein [Polyangium spumosum]MRG93669.1 hypothetical protein [Polyangium spumosum]
MIEKWSVDTNMTTEKEIDPFGGELTTANVTLLVKSLERHRTFAEAVDDHRRLEAEFVARAGDDEFAVLQTRRCIAETILSIAREKHPPFEVCREAWSEVLRLGFTDLGDRCNASRFFADCCAYDENPEEGLAVLDPLVADLERGLEEARATQNSTEFYEYELESLLKLRDVLRAQRRGEPIQGKSTRRLDEAP